MSDNIKKLYNEHLKEFKKDYPKLNLILFENQHHKKIDKDPSFKQVANNLFSTNFTITEVF